jgi:MGT family glycosyltransferase
VYASFGTLLERKDLLEMIAAACADLEVQLVLSARGDAAIPSAQFAGSPIVVAHAPQLELLKRAALCITHAGLNTVMESLSFGVPMVALPITNDQPAVAARVRRVGAGEVIPPGRATAVQLRGAIERVLHAPGYRQAAVQMQRSIAQAGGVRRAADIIETALPRA